jgi:hypothetical protein
VAATKTAPLIRQTFQYNAGELSAAFIPDTFPYRSTPVHATPTKLTKMGGSTHSRGQA